MKISDIREMRKDELSEKLENLEKQLYSLRCQGVTEKLQNVCAKRNIRRDIARLHTVMRENELKGL